MKRPNYNELTLLEFQEKFPTEEACRAHLMAMRWPDGYQCRNCQSRKVSFKPCRNEYQCHECDRVQSVIAGTLFHKTKVPLLKWFWAIYLLSTSKKAVSTLYLSQQLRVNYKTAWGMRHKIQKAMEHRDGQYTLSGTVEADEIWIGGKQKFKERREFGPNKTPFFIAVEENRGGAPRFAKTTELQSGYDKKEIAEAAKKAIPQPATVKTDGQGAYLELLGEGHTLEQSVQIKQPETTAEHLKWVNIVTSNLKRYLLSTHHGVFPKYRSGYLSEFLYRFNRRFWPRQAFDRLLFANIFKGPTPVRAS